MLLRLHRLPKNGLLATVLVLHGARRRFQVLERLGNSLGRVRDHRLGIAVDLQQSAAAGTGDLELRMGLGHTRDGTVTAAAVTTVSARQRARVPEKRRTAGSDLGTQE